MLAREVLLALHLGETARGAREQRPQPLAAVELGRRRCRRDDEVDVAVVELVDERNETARFIVALRPEDRHAGDDHRLVLAPDLDVVVLTARRGAERAELEPRHPGACADHRDRPPFDLDRAAGLRLAVRETGEERGEPRLGVGGARREVGARLRELPQPVIGRAGDAHHLEMALEEGDGGQEALPLQAVPVELRRRHVGRRHQRHPAAEQAVEERPEDHRVGDIRHVQLIEAQHPRGARQRPRDLFERGALTGDALKLRVHLVHEAVEMYPPRLPGRQAPEEQIHEEGLAATHAAPEVQSAHRRARRGHSECAQRPREKRRATLRRLAETPPQRIEPLDHGELRDILLKPSLVELGTVALEHGRRRRAGVHGRRIARARRGSAHVRFRTEGRGDRGSSPAPRRWRAHPRS